MASRAECQLAQTSCGEVEFIDRGEGLPVLVVHGAFGGVDQGSLLSDFLVEAGFRAIIPSRPGYLRTPLTTDNKTIDGQADLFAALMASLEVPHYAVFCWSGGGPAAYRLAVRRPERVTHLVAAAAVSHSLEMHASASEHLMFGTGIGNWLLKAMAHRTPKQLIASTLGAEGDLTKEQLKELTDEVFDEPVEREFVLGMAGCMTYRDPKKAGLENDKRNFGEITDLELFDIQAPTRLIHGRVDTDVVPEFSEYAAARVPNVETEWIDEGTHLAVWTGPGCADVQARVVDFLRN